LNDEDEFTHPRHSFPGGHDPDFFAFGHLLERTLGSVKLFLTSPSFMEGEPIGRPFDIFIAGL